jgi:hypothetical protein
MSKGMKKIASRFVIGLVVLLVVFLIWDYMYVDHCSDRGGLWNYREFKCEM